MSSSEWAITTERLLDFGRALTNGWDTAVASDAPRVPGEKQCKFCKAKGDCPALAKAASEAFEEYSDADQLTGEEIAEVLPQLKMIEDWISAVREKAHEIIEQGGEVPGYKLVEGRRGNRAWSDASKVEDILKNSMRLRDDEAYDMKLISPTTAEKRLTARRFDRLKEYIHRADGKPQLVQSTDKRPALAFVATADDFDDVSAA